MTRPSLLARTFVPALLAGLAGARQDAAAPRIELPPGPAADLAARAEAAGEPAPADGWRTPWPGRLEEGGWNEPAPWRRWASLIQSAESPGRRVRLALAAAAQGRHGDAWRHFAAAEDDLALARAVLPHLFPGVPLGLDAAAALPADVELRPLLPPAPRPLRRGEILPRSASVRGLAIAGARVDLTVELATDGVQVDALLASGEPTSFAVVLPEPRDWIVRVEYFDWERLETVGAPHRFDLTPGVELSSWGRFAPRNVRWPGVPTSSSAVDRLRRSGARIEAAPELADAARGFGVALEELLGRPVPVGPVLGSSSTPEGAPARTLDPTTIRLEARDGWAELAALVSIVEALLAP